MDKTAEGNSEQKVQEQHTKKGKVVKVARTISYRNLPIKVEVFSGDYKTGYSNGGKWRKRMYVNYGFIPRTEGEDGEEIDVYLKPHANKTAKVYIVHQMKIKDGEKSYDEDKVMLGFDSLYEARSCYLQHMPEKYFGGIIEVSFEDFMKRYLEYRSKEIQKEANQILKSVFCKCGSDCCESIKSAENKISEEKEADIVKEVPAFMSLIKKVKNKSLQLQ